MHTSTLELPFEQWSVCLPEHHPGYVSWPEYLATRERLRANARARGEGGAAAREGSALLQGLVRCGRCGRRMQVGAEYEAERAPRQFDACEPEHRLVARSLERAWEEGLAALERERGKLVALEQCRPARLSDQERRALARLARDLPRLWSAPATSDRERKELLRTLIGEVVVTCHVAERRAEVEIGWEGGARTQLSVRLNARGPERRRIDEGTLELIGRLSQHHPDQQIAAILARQGRLTGTGLPFTETRVKAARQRAGIPSAPPADPASELVTIAQAAAQLGISTFTVRRWLGNGLLPGEQTTPGAPWRIRLSDELRRRFVPDVPEGYVALDEAARRLGFARQTVLHKVQRGELRAIEVTKGRRKGFASPSPARRMDCLRNDDG